jgi:ParB/RepB/Spo0J family partition protein
VQSDIKTIPIEQLIEPRLVLRLVNRESVEYLEMRDSIAQWGFWNSICVRPCPYDANKYEVVDGLYRFTCARELMLPGLPCIIKEGMTDNDVLAAQIQANAVRPETKPVEFARQLKRIMASHPGMTRAELAIIVRKHSNWISERLGLLNLIEPLQKDVDRGEIPVMSAYLLAKVCKMNQREYAEAAKTLPYREFQPLVASYLKAAHEAVTQGRADLLYSDYREIAYLRNVKEIQAEYTGRNSAASQLKKSGAKTAVDGWCAALQWVLHLDSDTVAYQRAKAAERKKASIIQRKGEMDDVT